MICRRYWQISQNIDFPQTIYRDFCACAFNIALFVTQHRIITIIDSPHDKIFRLLSQKSKLKQQRPDQSVFSDIKNTELELKS